MSRSEELTRPGLLLTAVGPDRPGLVNQLASLVRRSGGNIEDTRMAKLGGEFAVLVFVTGPAAVLSEIAATRGEIEAKLGVRCFVKETARTEKSGDGLHYHLQVSGFDRPGIVESVSRVFVHRSVNVASLNSRVVHAPLTGTPMFLLEAELQVPTAVSLSELRRELQETCDRENLDYSLEPGRA